MRQWLLRQLRRLSVLFVCSDDSMPELHIGNNMYQLPSPSNLVLWQLHLFCRHVQQCRHLHGLHHLWLFHMHFCKCVHHM